MNKIFISTFPFSRTSSEPLECLKRSQFDYALNTLGRKLKGEELFEMAKEATAVVVGTEDLSTLVEKSEHLKLIARIGIGLDSVPLEKCRAKGISVCYTPDAVTDAVAELTLGLMITLTRKVFEADQEIHQGKWQRFEGKSLKEQVIGLFGFGRIGIRVCELLAPFGPVEVLVCDLQDKTIEIEKLQAKGVRIRQVSFEELIVRSDLLSIHTPKTPKTNNLFNDSVFRKMKPGSLLVNTARGGIVNEEDLMKNLENSVIGGAALDVFSSEPYAGKLCQHRNVILTQHMGSCSIEARNRMEREAVEDVIRFLKGERMMGPVNIEQELNNLKV